VRQSGNWAPKVCVSRKFERANTWGGGREWDIQPNGPYSKVNPEASPETSYTDNSVVSGQRYFYVVTSVNSENIESSFSNEVSATIPSE
jgi:hypothetical protein